MPLPPTSRLFRAASAVGVTAYLSLVAVYLMATRQVPSPRPWLRSFVRPRYRGLLAPISPEESHCFVAAVPEWLTSDAAGHSALIVSEDGRVLPHGHAAHTDIRQLGGGRYSHWGAQVYFSSSDGSDPRTNGRRYTAEETL